MESSDLNSVFRKLKFGEDAFHELMLWRIRHVLLVLPHYDAWILEHDAKLSDQIIGEYHQLNLTTVPRLTTAASAEEALDLLKERSFDLMIVGMRTGDLSPVELAVEAKELNSDLTILMLLSSRSDIASLSELQSTRDLKVFDANFIWTGDSRLLLAMIKYVEDKRNAPDDTVDGRVGVLLVVEDSIAFYSAYLPLLYGEMMSQTQRLIVEELNDFDKYWRMRTRPKVLLARNWEEAVELGECYRMALIGIVSDIAFTRDGIIDERAGFTLIEKFRSMGISVPILFQSSNTNFKVEAERREARFQAKLAVDLHKGIQRFILEELGFGDFIFRDVSGNEIKRVRTLREFEIAMANLPASSLNYHSERNDYSRWLAAHGEYRAARKIKPLRSEDFPDPEDQRNFLLRSIRELLERRYRGRLVEFSFDDPAVTGSVSRYGKGSLGGKGRGLAFFNAMLNASLTSEAFPPIQVEIPQTLIIATGEFDRFLENNQISLDSVSNDNELRQLFLSIPIAEELTRVLETFIERSNGPLAVRSSSLLEDSQSIPFAGVYDTYMIPGELSNKLCLKYICDAIRLVWASTYSSEATKYRIALRVGREEEKMAIVIQRIAGREYHGCWFPRLSGTAQSINYYPVGPMKSEDGVARIAVGLGYSVVGGDKAFLFCPRYPAVPWGSEEVRWREGQTHFWGLRCEISGKHRVDLSQGEAATLECLSIREAEKMGILRHMSSTWDPTGHRIIDGMNSQGPRVVDFRDILSYDWLPLAPLIDYLLRLSRIAMGLEVELEFALDWKGDLAEDVTFSLLQVRPLISQVNRMTAAPDCPDNSELILRSEKALGHGIVKAITDILWVDPDLYDPGETEKYRDDVSKIMEELASDGRFTVVIGPGRWGSRDRFLGIPVSWTQVRQAKLIVEVSRNSADPEPSQGSHFFHNLISLGVGYAHILQTESMGFVDWNFLRERASGNGPVCLSRLENPVDIVIDGSKGSAWIPKSAVDV